MYYYGEHKSLICIHLKFWSCMLKTISLGHFCRYSCLDLHQTFYQFLNKLNSLPLSITLTTCQNKALYVLLEIFLMFTEFNNTITYVLLCEWFMYFWWKVNCNLIIYFFLRWGLFNFHLNIAKFTWKKCNYRVLNFQVESFHWFKKKLPKIFVKFEKAKFKSCASHQCIKFHKYAGKTGNFCLKINSFLIFSTSMLCNFFLHAFLLCYVVEFE